MRSPKFTADQVIAALRASGGIQTIAASKLGCDRTTIRRYIARNPEIAEALHELLEESLDLAEASLLQLIREKSVPAILFYLRCKGKARGYSERVEVNGQIATPAPKPQPFDYSHLSIEEKRELLRLMHKTNGEPEHPAHGGARCH